MGKVTGLHGIRAGDRRSAAPVAERVNDWFEVYQPFPEEKVRTQGARCMDCGVPFCHTGCPLNNIIPDWNDLVYRDRWQRSDPRAARHQQLPGVHRPRLPGAVRSRRACSASTSRR